MTRLREVSIHPVEMAPLELGEGARWFGDGPVQVDLLAGRLLAHRHDGVDVLLDLDVPIGAAAPRAGGGLALVAGSGVRLLRSTSDPAPVVVETGADPATFRVNDATTDDQGHLWFGVMRYDGRPGSGSLWRLDPELNLSCVLEGVTVPNGPVVDSTRGVLYLADSALGVIHRYELDSEAAVVVGSGRDFATITDASPDGMALDADGGVWSAMWGGSRLHRYDPEGRLTEVVPLPVRQPTSLALDPDGGPALVTSAWHGLPDRGALDGRSLWVDLAATAQPTHPFGVPPR